MPPRPFPYALGIGTDICHVPRIQRLILRHEDGGIERFGSKIFNEFERQFFNTRLSRYNVARAAAVPKCNGHDGASSTETLANAQDMEHSIPLKAFARWIAGRFAAKEAAIKAITHRRLFHHDVTILMPDKGFGKKPYARIEPPTRMIKIPYNIARQRGIHIDEESDFIFRPKMVHGNETQVAELSISHDGDYATAMVMAVNEPSENEFKSVILDLGKALPLHEPKLFDDFKAMDDYQLGWFVRKGKLLPLMSQRAAVDLVNEEDADRFARLLPRLKALRAELDSRGIRTGLEDDHNINPEESGSGSLLGPSEDI
ncbi:MAG: hypothetical protein M1830_002277 [Pleopsidium flavum]|nr:MAG: hypothetical protein M1830_002277 [Pleopsidium flavum]